MKTAAVSIVITFFLGVLTAYSVVNVKSGKVKALIDG
ncbi:MAG TPA: molybdate ABC transporter permease subunit, partial [Lachnoclostridium sp.]|nr:molybdate ABC transporter permease subunit [Lachnoclostridium sp.]